jgi:glutamate/tyrosine decarboxylase-like PLP-dependent enzyme
MRLNIELPEARVDDLKLLMTRLGVETYKDLFNNALTLLEWTVTEVTAGRSIASVDEAANKYRELAMPIFDHARKSARQNEPTQTRNWQTQTRPRTEDLQHPFFRRSAAPLFPHSPLLPSTQ